MAWFGTNVECGVQLRASVTNSGSQTRAQLFNSIFSDLKNAYDADNKVLLTTKLRIVFSSGDTYIFDCQGYNATSQAFPFFSDVINANGDTSMHNAVSIAQNSSKFLYCRTTVGSNWVNLSDVSNNTDLQTVELYY